MRNVKYSEWTVDEKNNFRSFVETEYGGTFEDICIVGSYVWGPGPASDIDVVVYVDEPVESIRRGSYIKMMEAVFDNKRVEIFVVPNAIKLEPCYKKLPAKPGGLNLPKISIIDGTVYGDLNHDDIEFKKSLHDCNCNNTFDKLTPERISMLESMGWDTGGLS